MSAGRALIAVPLPPPSQWLLLRDLRDLPDGFGVVGQITVGRDDPPALPMQTPAKALAPPGTDADHDQVAELLKLYARMAPPQRRSLLTYARDLAPSEVPAP